MPTCCCLFRLYGVAALFFFGYTSAHSQSSVCYGDSFLIPKHLVPPVFKQKIFYTPMNGLQRLVVDEGKSLDPLFVFLPDTYSKKGWTHEDEGTITVPSLDKVISISVADCKDPKRKHYGDSISWLVMSATQYLQFVPLGSLIPVVLWNRTDPKPGRGVMEGYRYAIFHLTQKDSGYYNFRGARNELLRWTKLEVTNYMANLSHYTGDVLHYKYPITFTEWKARLFPQHPNYLFDLHIRVKMSESALDIQHVEMRDTGLYEFVDYENNIMLQIHLKVTDRPLHPGMIFGTTVVPVVVLMIFCCCCVRKCRAKRKSRKNNENAPEPNPEPASNTAAAPPAGRAVYYHHSDPENPHMETLVNGPTTAPTVDSSKPSTYSAVMADMNPPPKVSGDFGAATASPDPQFNIRGLTFPSAPPLSADTFTSNTYTSEKINFL